MGSSYFLEDLNFGSNCLRLCGRFTSQVAMSIVDSHQFCYIIASPFLFLVLVFHLNFFRCSRLSNIALLHYWVGPKKTKFPGWLSWMIKIIDIVMLSFLSLHLHFTIVKLVQHS